MKFYDFLRNLVRMGHLNEIDFFTAELICRMAGESTDSPLMLLAALASRAPSMKNDVCVPMDSISTPAYLTRYLDLSPAELKETGPVPPSGDPASWFEVVSDGSRRTPLVLSRGLLYLAGNFREEQNLLRFLHDRTLGKETPEISSVSEEDLCALTKLPLSPDQTEALRKAAGRRFLLITGGPGTGKTTIISLLLALRLKEKGEMFDPSRILLCAPTGKAQARMRESLVDEIARLELPEESKNLLRKIACSTIHRLLRYNPSTGKFSYGTENRLSCDLIVIDEASMISQDMMATLFGALPDEASVILLGDRGQLASVEAGAVFGDFGEILKRHPENYAKLSIAHRFDPARGIGKIKDILSETESDPGPAAWECLRSGSDQLLYSPLPRARLTDDFLRERITESGIRPGGWFHPERGFYFEEKTLDNAWERFESLRFLTPVNNGPFGVRALNEQLASLCGFERGSAVRGMPVLIRKNDYSLGLANGISGLFWPGDDPETPHDFSREDGTRDLPLYVFFRELNDTGGICWRGVPAGSLDDYESGFAISVHKSQGSGYGRIVLFLPSSGENRSASILTRELVYTGITRARRQAEIITAENIFLESVRRTTRRTGGLLPHAGDWKL